jgi:phenylpropionate dioxygenase-like ring-hydroxylating dioxygenase large terminal subunit
MIDDAALLNDWHAVAHVSQFEGNKPLGVRLLGEDLVLWRPNGAAVAWQDLCIHRGTRLSLGQVVEGERLECPYHGWTYDEQGRCVHIPAHPEQAPPAKARAKTYHARECYGFVWVCLGEPAHDLPPFPEWDDDSYRKVYCGGVEIGAAATRVIENFLDVGHFPFVHEGYLGDRSRPEIAEYEAEIGPEGIVAEGVRVYQPDGYGTGEGGIANYTYRVFRPFTAYILKSGEGRHFVIYLTVTPHDALRSTGWVWYAQNYGWDTPEQQFVDYSLLIFNQDIPIVQSQRPELLPLDLQAELHLRSDRTAIAYRKWLRELGVTFGTS